MEKKPNNQKQYGSSGAYFQRASHRDDTAELPELLPPVRRTSPASQQKSGTGTNKKQEKSGPRKKTAAGKPAASRPSARGGSAQGRTSQNGARRPVQQQQGQYRNREELRRMQDARRKKIRRRRKILLSMLLSVVVAAVAVTLCLTVFFKIEAIEVTGAAIYAPEQVVQSAEVNTGENLFIKSASKMSALIETRCPYIREVKIKRSLPATLKIQVKEDVSTYAVAQADGYVLLNDVFKVLEAEAEEIPDGTTLIEGMEYDRLSPGEAAGFTDQKMFEKLKKIASAIQKNSIQNITKISLTAGSESTVTYAERIQIKLGGVQDLEYRLQFAMKSIEQLETENPNASGTLDISIDKYGYFTSN